MQERSSSSQLASRYVGGINSADAITKACSLLDNNIRTTLFYLGEYIDTPELVELNVQQKLDLINKCRGTPLDIHVSVDPTQIGFSIDRQLGKRNAVRIAKAIKEVAQQKQDGLHCLTLDMADTSVTEDTIALHDYLHAEGYPVGLTLQAYLRRTPTDMALKIQQGALVRLVKGAFAERSDLAFTKYAQIKQAYRHVAQQMLSHQSRDAGFYPIFATHDHKLHAEIIEYADSKGWKPDEYEIEMLYGARPDVTKELADAGHRVRLYLPFGEDWWPYAVRRIAENPRNVMMLTRAILNKA